LRTGLVSRHIHFAMRRRSQRHSGKQRLAALRTRWLHRYCLIQINAPSNGYASMADGQPNIQMSPDRYERPALAGKRSCAR
jgi:hypothetical protein